MLYRKTALSEFPSSIPIPKLICWCQLCFRNRPKQIWYLNKEIFGVVLIWELTVGSTHISSGWHPILAELFFTTGIFSS
jgi:hypothetical protein